MEGRRREQLPGLDGVKKRSRTQQFDIRYMNNGRRLNALGVERRGRTRVRSKHVQRRYQHHRRQVLDDMLLAPKRVVGVDETTLPPPFFTTNGWKEGTEEGASVGTR